MKFKKLLSLLLVICMILSITACGIKASDDEDDDDNGKKSSQSSKDDDEDEDSNSKDNDDEDDEDKDDNNDEDESSSSDDDKDNPYAGMEEVDLPKGYPEDIFPIYKGGKVITADSNDRDGINEYGVFAVFDTKLETVDKFYKDLVEDSEDFVDQTSGTIVNYVGKLEGYNFNMTLLEDGTNPNYSVLTLELKEIPGADKLLESLAEGELPEKYPVALFPVIDGGAINDASESESDGKVSFRLTIYTEKTFKEIVEFYEEKIGAIEDKNKTLNTDDFELGGTAHDYSFDIYGGKSEVKSVELTRYYINLDPITE